MLTLDSQIPSGLCLELFAEHLSINSEYQKPSFHNITSSCFSSLLPSSVSNWLFLLSLLSSHVWPSAVNHTPWRHQDALTTPRSFIHPSSLSSIWLPSISDESAAGIRQMEKDEYLLQKWHKNTHSAVRDCLRVCTEFFWSVWIACLWACFWWYLRCRESIRCVFLLFVCVWGVVGGPTVVWCAC